MEDGGAEVRPTCSLAPKYLSNTSIFLQYITLTKFVDAAAKANITRKKNIAFSFRYRRHRHTIVGVPYILTLKAIRTLELGK